MREGIRSSGINLVGKNGRRLGFINFESGFETFEVDLKEKKGRFGMRRQRRCQGVILVAVGVTNVLAGIFKLRFDPVRSDSRETGCTVGKRRSRRVTGVFLVVIGVVIVLPASEF